eukprot:g4756.t1
MQSNSLSNEERASYLHQISTLKKKLRESEEEIKRLRAYNAKLCGENIEGKSSSSKSKSPLLAHFKSSSSSSLTKTSPLLSKSTSPLRSPVRSSGKISPVAIAGKRAFDETLQGTKIHFGTANNNNRQKKFSFATRERQLLHSNFSPNATPLMKTPINTLFSHTNVMDFANSEEFKKIDGEEDSDEQQSFERTLTPDIEESKNCSDNEERAETKSPATLENESLELARQLMEEEQNNFMEMLHEQQRLAVTRMRSNQSTDDDINDDHAFAMRVHDELEAGQDGEAGNMDLDEMNYEEILELEHQLGDVKLERWARRAESVIAKLPVSVLKSDSSDVCLVCQMSYEEGDELMHLPCKHNYHSECIKIWLRQKSTCPVCKSDIEETMEK